MISWMIVYDSTVIFRGNLLPVYDAARGTLQNIGSLDGPVTPRLCRNLMSRVNFICVSTDTVHSPRTWEPNTVGGISCGQWSSLLLHMPLHFLLLSEPYRSVVGGHTQPNWPNEMPPTTADLFTADSQGLLYGKLGHNSQECTFLKSFVIFFIVLFLFVPILELCCQC
jgi:hypothetical protein